VSTQVFSGSSQVNHFFIFLKSKTLLLTYQFDWRVVTQLMGQLGIRSESWVGKINLGFLGQHKDKSCYYYNFKIRLEDWPRTRLGSRVRLTIDLVQYNDKSGYYYSFKIQLGGLYGARPGRVSPVWFGSMKE
jgi:hypothetical protein